MLFSIRCLVLTSFFICIRLQDIFGFKNQTEGYVIDFATRLSFKYYETDCQCNGDLFYECNGTNTPKCYEDFPKRDDCLTPGIYMSDKPAYRFSGKTSSIDPKKISCEQGRFVCQTHAEFSYSSITDNRKSRYTKIYAGSSSGAFVSHPGAFDHCDKDYDPRARPWYIAGATGGKNVLLFFNIQKKQNRQRALEISQYLINTTNTNDWMMVVDLNNCNDGKFCKNIGKATDSRKNGSNEYLNQLVVGTKGWTQNKYEMVGQKSQQFFTYTENITRNVVVLVTDVEPQSAKLKQKLETSSLHPYFIRFFPILVGNMPSTQIEEYACQTNGVLIHDTNKNEYINDVMNPYLTYFTMGLSITRPVWSSVYEDAFGFGKLVTVTMPSYDQNGNLLGVIGLDVTVQYLLRSFSLTESELQDQLLSFNAYNDDNNITCDCCSSPQSTRTANVEWDLKNGYTDQHVCCSLTTDVFIGVFFAILFVIVLIGIIIYCKRKKQKPEARPEEEKHEEEKHEEEKPEKGKPEEGNPIKLLHPKTHRRDLKFDSIDNLKNNNPDSNS